MSDTSSEAARILAERYRELTPATRVRMAASMFKVATALARAGLRLHNPDAPEAELRLMLLRRLYDGDLSEAEIRLAAAP